MASNNFLQNKSESETLFFFEQPDPNKSTQKRRKKFVDEQFLNRMNKKTSNQFSNVTVGGTPQMSLASRVAELAAATATKSAMDSTPENIGGSENPSSMSTTASVNSHTDTRLQAVKYLTEDFLKELEELLYQYADSEVVPNLPGPVIFDLHSDWTDLTDKCSYTKFPEWQTRKGKEGLKKNEKLAKKNQGGSALDEHGEKKEGVSAKNGSRRSSSSTKSKTNLNATGGDKPKLVRQTPKLGSINEDHLKSPSQLGVLKASPANVMASLPPPGHPLHPPQTAGSNVAVQPPASLLKSKPESVSSRVMNQANQAAAVAGCLLNYQLSSRLYRDKGWTVVHVDGDAELVDNGKRILAYLKNSILSM
jgi:hypothetical protein